MRKYALASAISLFITTLVALWYFMNLTPLNKYFGIAEAVFSVWWLGLPMLLMVLYSLYYVYIEKVRNIILRKIFSTFLVIISIQTNIWLAFFLIHSIVGAVTYQPLQVGIVKPESVTIEESKNLKELQAAFVDFQQAYKKANLGNHSIVTLPLTENKEKLKEELKVFENLILETKDARNKILQTITTKRIALSEKKTIFEASEDLELPVGMLSYFRTEGVSIQWELLFGNYAAAIQRYTGITAGIQNLMDVKNPTITTAVVLSASYQIIQGTYINNYNIIQRADLSAVAKYLKNIEEKYQPLVSKAFATEYNRINPMYEVFGNSLWPWLDGNKSRNELYKVYQLKANYVRANKDMRPTILIELTETYERYKTGYNLLLDNPLGRTLLPIHLTTYSGIVDKILSAKTKVSALRYAILRDKIDKVPVDEVKGTPLSIKEDTEFIEIMSGNDSIFKIKK